MAQIFLSSSHFPMIPTLTYFSNSDFLILYLDPTIIFRHVNIQIITLQSLRSSNLSKYQFLLQLQTVTYEKGHIFSKTTSYNLSYFPVVYSWTFTFMFAYFHLPQRHSNRDRHTVRERDSSTWSWMVRQPRLAHFLNAHNSWDQGRS